MFFILDLKNLQLIKSIVNSKSVAYVAIQISMTLLSICKRSITYDIIGCIGNV